jgi:hypothetical protein
LAPDKTMEGKESHRGRAGEHAQTLGRPNQEF